MANDYPLGIKRQRDKQRSTKYDYKTKDRTIRIPTVYTWCNHLLQKNRQTDLSICFLDHCLSFCPFSFDHCVVWSSSNYGFRLSLWYLHTLLTCWLIFTFCPFSFDHCVVWSSSNYGFRLSLWYLHTLLTCWLIFTMEAFYFYITQINYFLTVDCMDFALLI